VERHQIPLEDSLTKKISRWTGAEKPWSNLWWVLRKRGTRRNGHKSVEI